MTNVRSGLRARSEASLDVDQEGQSMASAEAHGPINGTPRPSHGFGVQMGKFRKRPVVIDVEMQNEPVPTAGHWNIMDIYSPGVKVHHVSTGAVAAD